MTHRIGRYDVPACANPSTGQCEHTTSGEWTVDEMTKGSGRPVKLLVAHGHCHAPTCLSFELQNADTAKVICRQVPEYGTGAGGAAAGSNGNDDNTLSFASSIPPCFWGDESHGLLPPPVLGPGTRLRSVKVCNNTFGHRGEMSAWQFYGVYAD